MKTRFIIAVVLLFIFSSPTHLRTEAATTRPKVALVLGGGAARGFSHVGVIAALESGGIPIDMVVGASMGSIVAGLYASGYSVENMGQITSSIDPEILFQMRIPPRAGVLDTERFRTFLDVLFEGRRFEELKLPFYCVITQLRTGEEVALNQGLLSRGVQASMSIPGMFPPVALDGKYYVDGGIKNAVPVDVARRLGADIVIGVDVNKDLTDFDYNSIINNLELTFWFMTDGYAKARMGDADVVIHPELKFDSYMDYHRGDYFAQKGYEAGMVALEDIKAVIRSHDPEFQFTAYRQPGYPTDLIEARIQLARRTALRYPGPLSVVPDLRLEYGRETYPAIGVIATGGPLGHWYGGYRYQVGLEPSSAAHEAIIGYFVPESFKTELFVQARTTDTHMHPDWGLRYEAQMPWSHGTNLELAYFHGGQHRWSATLHNPNVWHHGQWQFGGKLEVSQKYPDTSPVAQHTSLELAPEIRRYLGSEAAPVLQLALARPYVYGKVEHELSLGVAQSQTVYHAGLGSEFRLFGLHPVEGRIGASYEESDGFRWEFRFRSR